MDDGGQQENGRHRIDVYREALLNNVISQYQFKDQNAFIMSGKIMMICAEKDAAIEERNRALSEKAAALDERDTAIRQRDAAIAERDNATKERDNALAALQFQENAMTCAFSGRMKRMQCPTNHPAPAVCDGREVHITDVFPLSAIASDAVKSYQVRGTKEKKALSSKSSKPPMKRKKVDEDLNGHVTADESKVEWDARDIGLMNRVNFDESNIPAPVCSCTGIPRQCYKWSNGGWQSSCCTNTLSLYPLPQMPNKRHARIGGRKMSGSVFTRLISRLAAAGHDLSVPVDLKNYWAKHGTNRYITIK